MGNDGKGRGKRNGGKAGENKHIGRRGQGGLYVDDEVEIVTTGKIGTITEWCLSNPDCPFKVTFDGGTSCQFALKQLKKAEKVTVTVPVEKKEGEDVVAQ